MLSVCLSVLVSPSCLIHLSHGCFAPTSQRQRLSDHTASAPFFVFKRRTLARGKVPSKLTLQVRRSWDQTGHLAEGSFLDAETPTLLFSCLSSSTPFPGMRVECSILTQVPFRGGKTQARPARALLPQSLERDPRPSPRPPRRWCWPVGWVASTCLLTVLRNTYFCSESRASWAQTHSLPSGPIRTLGICTQPRGRPVAPSALC